MGDGYGEDGGNIPLLNCRINSAEIGWRQWLAPDPCNQCHKPVIYIREVRYADGVISWKLADHEKVKEIIVSGYDSGEYATIVTVPCVADTGSVRIGRGAWSDLTLQAYSNGVLLESSMPWFDIREAAPDKYSSLDDRRIGTPEKRERLQYVTPSHYVVVGRGQVLQATVSELLSRYQGVSVSYMGVDAPITANDIQAFYGMVYNANLNAAPCFPVTPGPELILVGPDIAHENYISTIIPSVVIEEDGAYCDEWSGRGCRSDWLLTDFQGTGRPMGPVTRIPALTVDEVIKAFEAADMYNINIAQIRDARRFHTLCWDTNERYIGEAQSWRNVYSALGYLSMPTLYRSEMPAAISDRWSIFAVHTAEGIDELFGAGRAAAAHAWFDILRGQVPHQLFHTGQAFLAYLPSCFTGGTYLSSNGFWVDPFIPDDISRRSIGITMMHNSGQEHNLKLAGMIGMKSATTATASLVIGETLLGRRQHIAEERNPSLAMLGFRTIESLLDTHPSLRLRTLQMVVLGAPVFLGLRSPTELELGIDESCLESTVCSNHLRDIGFSLQAPEVGCIQSVRIQAVAENGYVGSVKHLDSWTLGDNIVSFRAPAVSYNSLIPYNVQLVVVTVHDTYVRQAETQLRVRGCYPTPPGGGPSPIIDERIAEVRVLEELMRGRACRLIHNRPSSAIRYMVRKELYTELAIYDLRGRVIQADVRLEFIGDFAIANINPKGLSSGVYFVRGGTAADTVERFVHVR